MTRPTEFRRYLSSQVPLLWSLRQRSTFWYPLKQKSLLRSLIQRSSCCQGRLSLYRVHAFPWRVQVRSSWHVFCHVAIPKATQANSSTNRSMTHRASSVSPPKNPRLNSVESQWRVSPRSEVSKQSSICPPQRPLLVSKLAPSTSAGRLPQSPPPTWIWNARCRDYSRTTTAAVVVIRGLPSHWSITSTARAASDGILSNKSRQCSSNSWQSSL